jgi:hypothetical protein
MVAANDIFENDRTVHSFEIIENGFIVTLHAKDSGKSSEFEKFHEMLPGRRYVFEKAKFIEIQGKNVKLHISSGYIGGKFAG